ncbi:UDP-N-acetylmuramate dehydrogenase [Alteromonas sp. I10]|uniref:UDP-N-acetylmuramate dehydrogenase n=1 Tax=Alteromonas TaxID=226 RepID=UPI000C3CCF17|nr:MULTISPECIES: UDP-N-acetylmuramate dehydrogenase [Alteromonas]MBE91063.1 UDP-N-acetylenolpyruvoylglucosamine reductase [Rhodospirillaceae bacterium]PXW71530.1 UDP-N-acetylmuramate dehydrogenase [Alteromonas sp. I10]|tara:strand:- start:37445 stop:38419 length:975 start_codon:yes stop_codon:yes gene_type:complete
MTPLQKLFLKSASRIGDSFCNVSLSEYSYWKAGGKAELVIVPKDFEQLKCALMKCNEENLPYLLVGCTSNLLFTDDIIKVPIIVMTKALNVIDYVEPNVVLVGSSVWVPKLARNLAEKGLKGVEHICGIPGTFGGLIYMNGGSLRRSISETLLSVKSLTPKGDTIERDVKDCNFSYRQSLFQKNSEIIVSAKMKLQSGVSKKIKRDMLAILRARSAKFPRKLPSCGSVFISNPKMYEEFGPPGMMIEKAGLKGFRRGGAQISEVHANFIVNNGQASSDDILYLIHLSRKAVFQRTGYLMDAEAHYVDSFGDLTPAHIIAELKYG